MLGTDHEQRNTRDLVAGGNMPDTKKLAGDDPGELFDLMWVHIVKVETRRAVEASRHTCLRLTYGVFVNEMLQVRSLLAC
jgi:hypothetical protein